jgi:cell division protein FtsL
MIPIYYIFIVVAISLAIIAEILVAYQKYQMKKQFVDELDRRDRKQNNESSAS